MFSAVLRSLRGSNLEIFKFGMYLAFPIGWMYYFGTNLENRFSVPDFWPTQEQSHRIPFERDEIKAEVLRINENIRERQMARLEEAKEEFRKHGQGQRQGRLLEEKEEQDKTRPIRGL